MLYQVLTNKWVIMLLCALCVFGEMFIAKKWFTSFTVRIKNEKTRIGANLGFGLATCVALAYSQMYLLCDIFKVTIYHTHIFAAAGIATLAYLILEKITEGEINVVGEAFVEYLAHSDLFEGEISKNGVLAVAKKLFNVTNAIDKKEASKEGKAIDKVVAKLDEVMFDGRITEEEEAEAEKLMQEAGVKLDGNDTYEKYKSLLSK